MDNESSSFDEVSQHVFSLFKREDFLFGIGDISNYTQIPQSKLRYWEKCGYIHAKKCSKNQNRKYEYRTLMKIQIIKSYLDSGFTLSAAAEKSDQFTNYNMLIGKMLKNRVKEIGTINDKPAINMGPLDDDQSKSIYFINDGKQIKAVIRDSE